MADGRRKQINILLLVVLGVAVVYFLLLGTHLGIVGLLVLIFTFKIVMDHLTDVIKIHRKRERNALRGAEGEDRVAEIMESLPDGFHVYHDVDTGRGDIDHVLISPEGGVFVVETKAHGGRVTFERGQMLINGRRPEKDFIVQALRNTYWVRDEIKRQTGKEVWVHVALVFANAFVDEHGPIRSVQVMNRNDLGAFIDNNKAVRNDRDLAQQVKF